MRGLLAFAALRGHAARTALAVLGVAVAAAMLLDMVMLSTGLRESFQHLLLSRGFQLRLAPRGTLPFDTEAMIPGATAILDTLRTLGDVTTVSPVLGAQLHVPRDGRVTTTFALGVNPAAQGDYELRSGRDPNDANELVANDEFLHAAGLQVGDTLEAATGYNPQLRTFAGQRRPRSWAAHASCTCRRASRRSPFRCGRSRP
jgi:putative ABC transport system permease protein